MKMLLIERSDGNVSDDSSNHDDDDSDDDDGNDNNERFQSIII